MMMQTVAIRPGQTFSARVCQLPCPERQHGEVLVRILEVGIDGADHKMDAGVYGEATLEKRSSSSAASRSAWSRRGARICVTAGTGIWWSDRTPARVTSHNSISMWRCAQLNLQAGGAEMRAGSSASGTPPRSNNRHAALIACVFATPSPQVGGVLGGIGTAHPVIKVRLSRRFRIPLRQRELNAYCDCREM